MKSPGSSAIPHFDADHDSATMRIETESRANRGPDPAAGDWGRLTRAGEHELQIDDRVARDQAERFLRLLAEGLPPRWLFEFRAFSRRHDRVQRCWLPVHASTAAVRWCSSRAKEELDVYVGVQPRHVLKGGASAVAALVVLYADLDCGSGKSLADKASALSQLQRLSWLGLRPSMLVDSGNGFHAYWPLREPLDRDGRGAWHDAMCAVARSLQADPSVTDLPRILRVPGTINWKQPREPKPVRLLELDSARRFTLLDFDDLFPVHQVEPALASTHVPATVAGARILAAIRAAGWRVREKRDHHGSLVALVLEQPCPFCPGTPHQLEPPRRGTAHVTPRSGTLRCKRALCAAGAMATGQTASGEAHGLPFDEWARRVAPGILAVIEHEQPASSGARTSLPRLPRLPALRKPR